MPDLRNCFFPVLITIVLLGTAIAPSADAANAGLRRHPVLQANANADGGFGIVVEGQGMASVRQFFPLQIEVWDKKSARFISLQSDYRSFQQEEGKWIGRGSVSAPDAVRFDFQDEWTVAGSTLRLDRRVKVSGNFEGGFRSAATLELVEPKRWPEVEWFMPGVIYGNFDHMRDNSIGARNYYRSGAYVVWIREDRLPAPLLGARFADGSTVAVLNSSPDGATTAAEAAHFSLEPMIDGRIRFGSIGAEERGQSLLLGYSFPGAEGELSYGRKTGKDAVAVHSWRRRYHPIRDRFTQHYQVAFRFDRADNFNGFVAQTWRWAWETLKPQVNPQDIESMRRYMVDVLAENVIERGDRAGVQIVSPAVAGQKERDDPRTTMGFIGYGLGAAEMMLIESERDHTERGRELRRMAEKTITSFLRIPMSPPAGEGFYIKTGALATTERGSNPEIFLRSFCDDMKSLMRAYDRERHEGRSHPEWLDWVRQFGDWLLTQEQADGGFPRSWEPKTGKVRSASTTGTFNVVPFYVQLYRLTGKEAYLDAAVRSGEFGWNHGPSDGRFTGGTIDNPDVVDKEAATIALEGYLALHEVTKDSRWLERARVAADIAETWMYIWNVPMPIDADDTALQWKRGTPTVGLQLIATGHSLVDAYMAFDVGNYARVSRLTDDPHYLDVARVLLHNTKAMVALPGRLLGLRGPGWQQEHYCLSLPRGVGRHQLWLTWVTMSQLRGINDLIDFDPRLYAELASPAPKDNRRSDEPH